MKITKLEHSGLILEKNGKKLVFDPVEITETLPSLEDVIAIIITHKHNDHFQPQCIERMLTQNPDAHIFAVTDLDVNENAGHLIEKVEPGAVRELPDFHLRFFGKNHASIIPNVVPCCNLGVVIDDAIVNPGDSFDLPTLDHPIKVLFVPSAAPWCRISDGMTYIKQAKPEIAVPVHDAVASDFGKQLNNNWLRQAAEEAGGKLVALRSGEFLTINDQEQDHDQRNSQEN